MVENFLNVYLSTLPSSNNPSSFGCNSSTFSNVKQDYCRDLDKIKKYFDIIFSDENKFYLNFNRVRILGGELGDLDVDYIRGVYDILSSYNDKTVVRNYTNTKVSVFTNGKIFDKLSYKEVINYKVNTTILLDESSYTKDLYKDLIDIDDDKIMFSNKNIFDNRKNRRFVGYSFLLTDKNDDFYYEKFKEGDFINVKIAPMYKHKMFCEEPFTIKNSKFYPGLFSLDKEFDSEKCSCYSLNFGIDFVNDVLFKCNYNYDNSHTIKLSEENLKKALSYNIEDFIPRYDNKEICKSCEMYLAKQELLTFNFKNRK